MKWNYFRVLAAITGSVMLITLLGAYALACSYVYLVPSLPSIESMRNVELQVPLRVYTRTGALIAQIGEQRRIPVTYDQIPELVKHAFLAAEDERFFEHHGIDYFGVVRAVLVDVVSGDKTQGASTITMQAARNMFLSLDKTARRKLQETFVTYRMEHEFSKQEIFGLYLGLTWIDLGLVEGGFVALQLAALPGQRSPRDQSESRLTRDVPPTCCTPASCPGCCPQWRQPRNGWS